MKIHILFLLLIGVNGLLFGQNYERYRQLPDTILRSNALGYDKKISITVPKEFQTNSKGMEFPVIMIFDSQNQRSYNYIIHTIDYLTSNEQMPASIIFGIESTQENRYKETQYQISDSAAFGNLTELFIFEELAPLATSTFQGNGFLTLIGHSRYGFLTTSLLTRRPDALNAVISISPFFRQKNVNLIDSVSNLIEKGSPLHHLYYRFAVGNDFPDDFALMQNQINQQATSNYLMNFKGYFFRQADHNATPGITISTALYDIFEYWSLQQNTFMQNVRLSNDSINILTSNIEQHYGSGLTFSLGTLNGKGWEFFNAGDFLQAINSWNRMLELYPSFTEGYLNIVYALIELNQDYTETLQKLQENLKSSEFYSAAEKDEIMHEIKELKK